MAEAIYLAQHGVHSDTGLICSSLSENDCVASIKAYACRHCMAMAAKLTMELFEQLELNSLFHAAVDAVCHEESLPQTVRLHGMDRDRNMTNSTQVTACTDAR